jgi:hypothetical protein
MPQQKNNTPQNKFTKASLTMTRLVRFIVAFLLGFTIMWGIFGTIDATRKFLYGKETSAQITIATAN